jgi:hypothetical protein
MLMTISRLLLLLDSCDSCSCMTKKWACSFPLRLFNHWFFYYPWQWTVFYISNFKFLVFWGKEISFYSTSIFKFASYHWILLLWSMSLISEEHIRINEATYAWTKVVKSWSISVHYWFTWRTISSCFFGFRIMQLLIPRFYSWRHGKRIFLGSVICGPNPCDFMTSCRLCIFKSKT